jgi:O-methyltransferase domain
MKDSPFVLDFLKILKTGKPANWRSQTDGADWHNSMLSEEFARNFTNLMHCRGLAFGQTLAKELSNELAHSKCLLDVGGGSGVYAQAFVRKSPSLSANILEQAPVDQIARESISQAGLSAKISVTTGNMFADEWPAHCDVHLLSNLLHDWDLPEVTKIIQKSASSIEKGGRLVIHQAFLNDEKSGPIEAAEYSTLLMHITQGRCYSRAELIPILKAAGFQIEKQGGTLANRGYLTATL